MQYPSRNADESRYVKRLERMTASQRARLRELLGNPPDAANVPPSFWQEVQEQAARENFLALYFIFQQSADYHLGGADRGDINGDTSDDLDDEGEAFAEALAAGMGQRWAETAQKRFDKAVDRWGVPGGPGEPPAPVTLADLENDLADIFSPDDAAGAAAYGMTSAESAGGEGVADKTFGQSTADKWKTNPHLTRSGPCERCEAMNGKPRTVWQATYPSGPPIHEYCACEIIYDNAGDGI